MNPCDVPLIKSKPNQVPLGFNSPDSPVMIAQIQLAKEPHE